MQDSDHKVNLSICAIMKNEGPYLIEWLEFHKLLGVERFYLYDNCSDDLTTQILDYYINIGEVIYHYWPDRPGQVSAYNHCLENHRLESEWIAFIDLDEFLFPTVGDNLLEILEEFSGVSAVVINWLIFGTSGHQKRPPGMQIENFNQRAENNFGANLNYKSIIRPLKVLGCKNPHSFFCEEDNYGVTENSEIVTTKITQIHSVTKLRINHYFTRSWQEAQNKIKRGRATLNTKRKLETIKHHNRNDVEDLSIHRFIPQLKQQIVNIQKLIANTTVSNQKLEPKVSALFPIPEQKIHLAICAIMKNEGSYLTEWLEFHKLVGVEKFYLYDNNSTDNTIDVIAPYVNRKEVIYHYWPEHPGQMSAYSHCLQNYGQETEWIAFIDLDEFLFPTEADDLKIVLQEFGDYPAVGVNWLLFGTSGHKKKPAGLQIENFILRAPKIHGPNKHVKCIVNPPQILGPKNPHVFQYISGYAVTENKEPLKGAHSTSHSVKKLCINHYTTRSKEESLAKMARGRATRKESRDIAYFENLEILLNQEKDLTIQRFLPQLKLALEVPHQIDTEQQSYTAQLLKYEALLEKYKFHLKQIESQLKT
jgi:glycosyltransferase involved in cell wall biosynthesis